MARLFCNEAPETSSGRNPPRRRHGRHPDRPGPGHDDGPSVVAVRAEGVFDITAAAPTVADLCNAADPVAIARSKGQRIGSLEDVIAALLAPIDLQAIKAAGVTFAVSLLERLIEEHAKGDLSRADTGAQGAELPDRRRHHDHQARLARSRGAEEDA